MEDEESRKNRMKEAIEWWVRLDAGALSYGEHLAFQAWLAKDSTHVAAFEEVCHFWGDLGRLPASPSGPVVPARRVWFFGAGTAAAAALMLFLAFDDLSLLWRADFATGTAQTKTVTLEDGSRVELNADSALARDFSGGRRRLFLLKGEAWFEVAADPSRPFTVEAAGGATTALGTSFDIATQKARTEVTVLEHSVQVSAEGEKCSVEAGQQTAYGPGISVLAPYAADPRRATAWRRGKLIFDEKPLGDVVAALGHYHHGFLFVSPSIRDLHVSGVFSTSKPVEALRAIELSLGLRALHLGDYLIVLRG